MVRIVTLCFIGIVLSGCSTYATSRYAVNADNVTALRGLKRGNINVGNFSATKPGEKEIVCRGAAPIKTPDGETFSEFIRKGLVDELKMAGKFDVDSPVTLTGNLNNIDFSSTNGTWNLSLTVYSLNGKSITVSESYSYTSSFDGDTACNQTAQALMPAVQNLIGKVVQSRDFKLLVN